MLTVNYNRLPPWGSGNARKIIDALKKNPELSNINSGIMRNEGHLKLYDNDKLVK